MTISRRALLGLAAGAFLHRAASPAAAELFVDDSGLARGHFVWQPAVAPEGPLFVVITTRQQVVHVYRGGQIIGISRLKGLAPGAQRLAGTFLLADQRRRHAAGDARLVWTADAVEVDAADTRWARDVLALLPDDFAALLFKATGGGATVVLADERGVVSRCVTAGFPLLRGSPGRTAAEAVLAHASRPVETADPIGRQAALVISLRDRMARLVRAGVIEGEARIDAASGARLSGSYVYSLVGRADGAGLDWLAMPIARTATAAHLDDTRLASVLDGLSFVDERAGLALAQELGRGVLIHVTDRRLPRRHRLVTGVEVMADRPAPALAPAPQTVAAAPRGRNRIARARPSRVTRTVDVSEQVGTSLVRQMLEKTR